MSGEREFDPSWLQYPIDDLSGGLNIDSAVVAKNELTIAENVDLYKFGAVSKRGGWRKCNATARTVTAGNGGIKTLYNFTKNISGTLTDIILGVHDGKIIKATPDAADKLIFTGFTELTTGLTAADRFYMATLSNRCFISSINHRLWTDGTTVYTNGVSAPTLAIGDIAIIASGGAMTIGNYYVAYSYLKSGDFEYETNISTPILVSITVNNSHLHVTVAASADPQIDKIRIYVSGPGGSTTYRQTEVANAAATIDVGVTTLLVGTAAPATVLLPPKAKWIISAGNRIFYIHTDEAALGSCSVRWSNINDGHSVLAASHAEFGAKDGFDITGAGLFQNYLVIFKRNAIYMLDIYDFNIVNTAVSDGCVAHDSIQSIFNGKALTYWSDSGQKVFDGATAVSISDKKVNTYLCGVADISKAQDKTCSIYIPTTRRYSISVQNLDGGYTWLNYYFNANGWSNYTLKPPTAMCSATDKNGSAVTLFAYVESTAAYICQMDYGTSDDGADIMMKFKTVPHHFDLKGVTKQVRRALLEWQASAPTTALFEVIVDYGTGNGVQKSVSHDGASYWGYFDWGHAFWGQSGKANDRIDLRGKGINYEFIFTETSQVAVVVYGLTILFYPISYQGVVDV